MSTSMGINMNINMNMSMSVSICVAVRMSRIKRSRGRRSNSSNEGVDMKCMRKQKILACDNLGALRPYMIYLIQATSAVEEKINTDTVDSGNGEYLSVH
jgi:membrane protease subunit (stomatin/prohibitin family)